MRFIGNKNMWEGDGANRDDTWWDSSGERLVESTGRLRFFLLNKWPVFDLSNSTLCCSHYKPKLNGPFVIWI